MRSGRRSRHPSRPPHDNATDHHTRRARYETSSLFPSSVVHEKRAHDAPHACARYRIEVPLPLPLSIEEHNPAPLLRLLRSLNSDFALAMGNHYHLIVETDLDVAVGRHAASERHLRPEFNERHGRTGHLFGDRFHCGSIRDDDHLREARAYVLNNPVRPASAPAPRTGRGAATGAKANTCSRCRPGLDWLRMAAEELVVHGAREHNLKDITVRLPRNKLVCITGLSGSGKSSLAFDTIYAEGQRRYVESLSRLRAPVPADDGEAGRRLDRRPLAGDLDRPEDDVAATRARPSAPSPRSTTTCACSTRASAARTARSAGARSRARALEQIVDQVLRLPEGTRFTVNAPVVRDRKGEYREVFEELRNEGFTRVKVDGEQHLLEEDDRARQEVQAHDRGRRRPARDEARPAHAALRSRSRRRRSSPRGSSSSTCSTARR